MTAGAARRASARSAGSSVPGGSVEKAASTGSKAHGVAPSVIATSAETAPGRRPQTATLPPWAAIPKAAARAAGPVPNTAMRSPATRSTPQASATATAAPSPSVFQPAMPPSRSNASVLAAPAFRAKRSSRSQSAAASSFNGVVTLQPMKFARNMGSSPGNAPAGMRTAVSVASSMPAARSAAAWMAGLQLWATGSPITQRRLTRASRAAFRHHQALQESQDPRRREVVLAQRLRQDGTHAAELGAQHVGEELVADDDGARGRRSQ